MTTPLTQDDFNRPTSQLAASSASLNTALAGLVSSTAQFMRSEADADSNKELSKSQSFLPSELPDAQAIDNTADQGHRSGLPPRDRDTNSIRPTPGQRAVIAADPTHPLHGVATFGLAHHEELSLFVFSVRFFFW